MILQLKHMSAMAKLRYGIAPLRTETGRYEELREHQRICPICKPGIENEVHAILKCHLYEDISIALVNSASAICFQWLRKMEIYFYWSENDTNMCQNLFQYTTEKVILIIFVFLKCHCIMCCPFVAFIPILQFRSNNATDWPTVELLHDLQVVFSNRSMGFKAGTIHCHIIWKNSTNFIVHY